MEPRAKVRRLSGKQLLCTARNRAVITDRPLDGGGTDLGFTSGELLLMAMGSCATGSLRNFFEKQGLRCDDLGVEIFFEPVTGERDRIVIEVSAAPQVLAAGVETIKGAATAGRVVSRVALGSAIEVRLAPAGSK
jgi:uncharacterized OsmC-like protein